MTEATSDAPATDRVEIETRWIGGGTYADALWTADLHPDEETPDFPPGEMLKVVASVDGETVASGVFSFLRESHGGHAACFNVAVQEDWRRQGLATAMYDAAEAELGEPLLPYPGNEGGAVVDFWRNRLEARGLNPDYFEAVREPRDGYGP